MGKTSIEWCDYTFNPWIGCTKVSVGPQGACEHCYAEVATPVRTMRIQWGHGKPRYRTSPTTWAAPLKWERSAKAFQAAHGRRQRVFCSSLADVFDNEVDPAWRSDLFKLIEATPSLDWLLLTKRIGNVKKLCGGVSAWPNVWLGATVVTQEEVDRDVPKLLNTPARVRFLSVEPMLGPIDVSDYLPGLRWHNHEQPMLDPVDWVICGGESGPKSRPMHPDWARSLRDQCSAAGVPFFFKQWGEWAPDTGALPDGTDPIFEGKGPCARLTESGWEYSESGFTMPLDDSSEWLYRLGKRQAGRMLNGRTWDECPEVRR